MYVDHYINTSTDIDIYVHNIALIDSLATMALVANDSLEYESNTFIKK